ncbi:MAG: hypothetical protein Q9225_007581 [Loekoesia sp. 1 TL-2023]
MHLINARTFKLEHFQGDDVPKYAILSHTWGQGEVLYRDISSLSSEVRNLEGWQKIRGCCSEALKNDIDFVWIDTCCINSDSSAELSEAINSMYRWYENAAVCYAYLSDVGPDKRVFGEIREHRAENVMDV